MAYKQKAWSGYQKPGAPKHEPGHVDPDAPGTPGKPGYEPPVKREDLDQKGKKIWDAKNQVPLTQHEEKKGTQITGCSTSEEINDLEDRIEFLNSDISEETSVMKKGKMIGQLNKLKARLKKMRKPSPTKDMKTGSYKQSFE